jgi:hypothetical protein
MGASTYLCPTHGIEHTRQAQYRQVGQVAVGPRHRLVFELLHGGLLPGLTAAEVIDLRFDSSRQRASETVALGTVIQR